MELNVLQSMLEKSNADIQGALAKAAEEQKTLGHTMTETKAALDKLTTDHAAMQKQLDALDARIQAKALDETAEVDMGEYLKKEYDLENWANKGGKGVMSFSLKGHHAARILGIKTTVTSDTVGRMTTGVLPIERTPGIVLETRRPLVFRDLIASRPTSAQVIDYVKVNSALSDGATQSPEGGSKAENAVTFTSASEKVKTIASWIPATRQILSDWGELDSFLRTGLSYYVRKETEDQLLNGNGAGETLRGIQPQATSFNTALLPAAALGWTLIDILGWAAAQVAIADEVPPSYAVLNPQDLWEVRMTKDSQGRYILGDPWSSGPPQCFGMQLVGTTAQTAGTFLIGPGDAAAAELRSRMELEIAIGEQHSDYFTKNLVAIRAEERCAMLTYRPGAFISGATTTSPA